MTTHSQSLENLLNAVSSHIIKPHGTLDCAPITSITLDSRQCTQGSLFFALPGENKDGSLYINQAIENGAIAVISQSQPPYKLLDVPFIQVKHARKALALISQAFYNTANTSFPLIGVTGTNGKTTVTSLLHHCLHKLALSPTLLGTIDTKLPGQTYSSTLTTPEAPQFHELINLATQRNSQALITEVSSHAIALNRLFGVAFHTAAFLNFSQDHLDFHKSLEDYFETKKSLFLGTSLPAPKNTVLNLDDPKVASVINDIPKISKVFTFSINSIADFNASNIAYTPTGTTATLHTPQGNFSLKTSLIGPFNLSNILAAVSIAHACNVNLCDFIQHIQSWPGPAGRLEPVQANQPFNILVDYAHTPDALVNVLSMLKTITPGRLITVFGCGGGRDPSKRPLMTQAALDHSDIVFATSDNPRSESIEAIFKDMQTPVNSKDSISFIPDRKQAIQSAIEKTQPGDTLLIAGKGHEKFQIFANKTVPFDDVEIAQAILNTSTLVH